MSRWWKGRRVKRDWKFKQWKVGERISRGKCIIPYINIEEINDSGVDDERHDNIGGDDDNYIE